MTRKTTSGAETSSAVSTSAPLRHSPVTAKSEKGASSWRTPRRAAGSSSAIKTFHLAVIHFLIWHAKYRNGTSFSTSDYLQRSSISIQRTLPLSGVLDSVTCLHRRFRIDANTIICHRNLEHIIYASCSHNEHTGIRITRDPMADRILHQMLQSKTRDYRRQHRIRNTELRPQSIRKPRLLDRHILPHQLQLFTQRHLIRAMTTKRVTQHLAQVFYDPHRARAVVITHQDGNRIQRVEKEVRIDLRLQCSKACTGQLLRQPRQLHLALSHLDKVANRVLDPHDAQVNSHAKRQRNEDPTQPLNAKLSPELTGTRNQLARKDQHQDQTQYLPTSGPGNTEQHREDQVNQCASNEMRPRQRPSF